jgi:hypothetical protein
MTLSQALSIALAPDQHTATGRAEALGVLRTYSTTEKHPPRKLGLLVLALDTRVQLDATLAKLAQQRAKE